MSNMMQLIKIGMSIAMALMALSVQAASVVDLQHSWAQAQYRLTGGAQLSAFERLVTEADATTAAAPDDAAVWLWSGIIKSSYASAKGGLGALKLAKKAKVDLERALSIQPTVLGGSAYASLGTLYLHVPGWPIGFGDSTKAEKLLLKALEINPSSIDNNYFYAEFLRQNKRSDEARSYYLKAMSAAPREGRELADSGRREDIGRAISQL